MLLEEGLKPNKKNPTKKKQGQKKPLKNVIFKKADEELKTQIKKVSKLAKSKQLDLAKKEFKRVINIMYRKKSDDIGNQVLSVFEIVRLAIVIGLPFCVHPALGLVSYIVDKVISEKVNEKSEKRVMAQVDRSIELCEEKLKNPNLTDEEKKQLNDMKIVLKNKKNNLDTYYSDIKSYKYSDVELDYESEDDDPNAGWDI